MSRVFAALVLVLMPCADRTQDAAGALHHHIEATR